MVFDPHARLFDDTGTGSRSAIAAWEHQLLALFVASPEAHATGSDGGWVEVLLEVALEDREVLALEIEPADLAWILRVAFPLKVMCLPTDAPGLFTELRAFWSFLDRAFSAPHAAACLAVLAEAEPVVAALGDTDRYGRGKYLLFQRFY